MITFGQRLKYLREKKGISQGELGKRFNLSQSTIAYYELNKKQPSQSTLNKMADFFDVTADYLLARTSHIINDQTKNDAWEIYSRLPQDKKKLVDDIMKGLLGKDSD